MLLLVVILLVAKIIVPLIDLCLKETALSLVKIVLYTVTTIFVLWALFVAHNYIH